MFPSVWSIQGLEERNLEHLCRFCSLLWVQNYVCCISSGKCLCILLFVASFTFILCDVSSPVFGSFKAWYFSLGTKGSKLMCLTVYVHVWLILTFCLYQMLLASFSWRDYSSYGFWWDHLRGSTIKWLCLLRGILCIRITLLSSRKADQCSWLLSWVSIEGLLEQEIMWPYSKPGVRAQNKML